MEIRSLKLRINGGMESFMVLSTPIKKRKKNSVNTNYRDSRSYKGKRKWYWRLNKNKLHIIH